VEKVNVVEAFAAVIEYHQVSALPALPGKCIGTVFISRVIAQVT
jgi:hypothetical protein